MMKSILSRLTTLALLAISLPLLSPATAYAAPLTAGNLVVNRFGDGSEALSSSAAPVFLDEFTTAGIFVQSLAMPTSISGSNLRLTDAGSGITSGYLSRSVDGQYIVVTGYDADVGTPTVAGTPNPGTARVIGRVDFAGNIDTTTALTDTSYTGNGFRSVTSTDGTQFWTSGNGSGGNPGTRYVSTLGGSTSSQVTAAPNNTRVVSIQGGQLFVSAMSGAFRGVNSVGSGIPTASGQTSTLLPGFDPSPSSPESAFGFVFADVTPAVGFLSTGFDTLWVADDRTAAGGGIQRWTFDGSTWTLSTSLLLGASGNLGARGLIGSFDEGSLTMTLFATTTEASANQIIELTDAFDGSSTWTFGTPSSIVTAPANEVFRGIAFSPIPEPQALFLFGGLGVLAWSFVRRRK